MNQTNNGVNNRTLLAFNRLLNSRTTILKLILVKFVQDLIQFMQINCLLHHLIDITSKHLKKKYNEIIPQI